MSRVCMIDDESIVGVTLASALDAKGHRLVVAEDGKTGIEMSRGRAGRDWILDLMMPGVNGFDVLVYSSDLPNWMKCPSSVLTAVTVSRRSRTIPLQKELMQ